jgi:hypothetical protein
MKFLGEAEVIARELKIETGQILFEFIDHDYKREIDVRVLIDGVEEENKDLILSVLPTKTTIRIYGMQVGEYFYRARFEDSIQEKINEVLGVYETAHYELKLSDLKYEFVSGGIEFRKVPVNNNVDLNFHVPNPLVSSSFRDAENFFKSVFGYKNLKLNLDVAYNKFKQVIPSRIDIDSSEIDNCIKGLVDKEERLKIKKLKPREISLNKCSFDDGCLSVSYRDVLFKTKIEIEIKHELFEYLKGESARQFLLNLGVNTLDVLIRFKFDQNMNVNFEEFSCKDLDKYFDLFVKEGFEFKRDILLDNISIENGGVQINFPDLSDDLTVWLENPDLLEIHDSIKPLIFKSLIGKRLVYEGVLLFNNKNRTKTIKGDCVELRNLKLPQIRQVYFREWMKSYDDKPQLKNKLKPVSDRFGILPQSPSDLMELLSENLKFKHEKYLKVLCDYQLTECPLYMTHTPTAFMFATERNNQWHFIFETVDTSNATYIWSYDKDINQEKATSKAVQEVSMLIAVGRMNYRKTKPRNCEIISHYINEVNDSESYWSKQLGKKIGPNQ